MATPTSTGTLNSTCCSSYIYDHDNQALTLTFKGSGESYTYTDVSKDEFVNMLKLSDNGSGVGAYVNSTIKKHPYS